MKLSLIIVLVLKLVSCAIIYSEKVNLKNAGKNLFNLNGSNVNTTLDLPKTQYGDKRNYFCSVCLNKALCKEKEKCYMCIKHCKNFKGQEHPKFKIATEDNFQPNEKIIFNTNTNTPSTEFTFDSKVKNDVFAKLINHIVKSALSKFSTISNKTFVPASFQQWNLQTRDNSIQTEETAINNNLIELNKNNENDKDIQGLPHNSRRKESSTSFNEYQQKVKRDLRASDFNRTQITEEKFNSARPYGGPLRKLNFSDTNKNKPIPINNEKEEHREELLNPIQDQPFQRMQTIPNMREKILPINESLQQIPVITNRNLVPQFDVNQNRRIFKTEKNGINSGPFPVGEGVDTILSSPLLIPNNEVKACNENLGDASAVDGKTFSLLQNLEKKIENIADLIKRGCKLNDVLKSENPENLNGLRLNKMKLPGLSNDIFSKPRNKINTQKANLFPNRIMEIPPLQSNNEDGGGSENPISANDDKILRDINPELFSENDDENSDQLANDNLNNEDELANNENEPEVNKQNETPISFRNQFRLRKNPLQNDQNKPLITDLIKQRIEKIKPNFQNRFANFKNDEQIPEENENVFEPEEQPEEKQFEEEPQETFEPGVPWNNNKERTKPNLLPRSKPHLPKIKEALQRNVIKDRLKNNALPLQPRDNFKPALTHLNNFMSKLSDAPFQKLPKANPPWNRITNSDIPKPHFPLNKLDAEKPGRIPFQRINSKTENAIADDQPKTRPFLFPKSKHPNLPLIHQRFGEPDDLDSSVPVGSSNTNYEQNPNTFLGHVVVPQKDGKDGVESLDDMENKKIFFEGTGVNLPLTIKKNPEGTYKVSLAVDNICSTCNEKSCNLNEGLVGSPPNEENSKSALKFKEINDNVENLSLPKNKPQGETNNKKFTNVRESNNVNEDIPEIKPRLFDKENNFFNRRRNNDGVELKQKPSLLFPRLSQIAKRSPSLLFNSPLLKLGENFLDSGDSDDFKTLNEYIARDLKNHANDLNTLDGKNGEKGAVQKRVALMKDVLTWMKNVAEENTV